MTFQGSKFITIISIFITCSFSFSQNGINFGFGAGTGYKCITNSAGFLIGLRVKKHFETYSALTFDKYSGFGYTIGGNALFLKKTVQPLVGIGFNHQDKSSNLAFGEPPNPTTIFMVERHNNLLFLLGLRWTVSFEKENYNRYISISPYLNYRTLLNSVQAVKLSGPPKDDIEEIINERIESGLGAGIGIMYYFGDRNKE